MVLAKDEIIVNEWEYATSKNDKHKSKHALVVTNKRIVSTVQSKSKITQSEIPVSSVQNVHLSHETPSKLNAIFMIVLGAILALVGIVCAVGVINIVMQLVSIIAGAVLLLIGVPMLIAGILRLNQGAFSVVLTTNSLPEYELMSVGIEKIYGKRKLSSAVKFHINNDIAKEIIDTIGAVILDNK